MRRVAAIPVASFALVATIPVPMAAHSWSSNCTQGVGYLVAWPDAGPAGVPDTACQSDMNWGDTNAEIRNFHDVMSAFHLRDREGDSQKLCAVFFDDAGYGGAANIIGPLTNDVHYVEDNLAGSGWNDKTDSHILFGESGSTCG
ncbi:MAG: hypothetical protein KF809_05225 [Chloroflexi bacterium]|nr:hypothetical protein [Chloroflexota bacterium]